MPRKGYKKPELFEGNLSDPRGMAVKLREVEKGITASSSTGGMLVATPTYFRNYNSCRSKRLRMIRVPLAEPAWTLDLDTMLSRLRTEAPTVVWLVTPNNPTGNAIPDEEIATIIDATPDDTLVVMDRTLVNIRPQVASRDLIGRFGHKQLAIMHSFSKYSGLSHLRVGFSLYSNVELGEEVRPLLPLGLGVEAALKGTRIIGRQGVLRPTQHILDNIAGSTRILEDFCGKSADFACTDFVGNYCLLMLPSGLDAGELEAHLSQRGIYIMAGRDFPEPRQDVVRLHTGGHPDYMTRTVEALAAL